MYLRMRKKQQKVSALVRATSCLLHSGASKKILINYDNKIEILLNFLELNALVDQLGKGFIGSIVRLNLFLQLPYFLLGFSLLL